MSVVRGRPPGLAGGISGTRRAYCSSLRACPAPKSPTKARLCAVHTVHLQEGSLLPEPPTSLPCAPAYPSRPGFSNGLSEKRAGRRDGPLPRRPPEAGWADGTTERVSVSSAERQANDLSFNPQLSADGRSAAFVTGATNLVTPDANGGSFP